MKEENIGRLLALYQSNLYFFSEKFPAVFDLITRDVHPFPFDCDDEGGVHLVEKDCSLSLLQEQELLAYQKNNSNLFFQLETDVSNLSENLISNPVFQGYKSNIDNKYRNQLLKEIKGRERLEGGGRETVPVAVAYASGYGVFIKRLLEDLDCLHFVIASCDVQEFKTICFLMDFREAFHFFSSHGRCLSVVLKNSLDVLSEAVADHLMYANPPSFLYYIPYFVAANISSIEYDFYQNVLLLLRRSQYGWGFADDEILGLAQGLENIKAGKGLVKIPEQKIADSSVAIVGSGPSIMDHIADLEKISSYATVVSCGSALSILKKLGIKPDIHFESERTELSVRVIEDSGNVDWLSDSLLVGPYNISPRYFSLASDGVMLMKNDDLLEPYASAKSTLIGNFLPTCVNGAVDLFLKLGVDRIYLFGVDFCFKDSSHHHASASFYYDEQNASTLVDVQSSAERDASNAYAVKGVCGEVYTTPFLNYAARSLVNSISAYPETAVINCSDGLFLDGTQSFINDSQVGTKSELLQYLKNCQRVQASEFLDVDTVVNSLKTVVDLVDDLFPKEPEELSLKAVLWNFYSFYEQLQKLPAAVCVQGGILHLAQIFYEGWLRVSGDREAESSWLRLFVTTLPAYVSEVIAEFQRCLTEASVENV